MHDIDRTQAEYWGEMTNGEYDGEHDEYEYDEGEDEYEYDEGEGEYEYDEGEDEYDAYEYGEGEGEGEYEYDGEMEGVFSEADEIALAAELLEVTNDQELDQFIGSLIKRGLKKTRFGRKLLKSRFARALGTIHKGVKGITKRLLPVAGKVAGGFFGGPAGAAIGGKLGSVASQLFELELEGLGPEDQEFEVARRIVRLGGEAVKQATIVPKRGSPEAVGQAALMAAARKHAPGLVKGRRPGRKAAARGKRQRGMWERRGNRIIIHGI